MERGKLDFHATLKNKVRKRVVIFLGFMTIAAVWYIEKTKLIPQYGMVFYEMGLHCEDRCTQNEKLQYFQKTARHNPDVGSVYFDLGLMYERTGNDIKSLESFIRAAEFDQTNMLAYYKAGLHYFRAGVYEQALRYFLRVYKGGGYPDDVRYYLARIYEQKKEYDLAIEYYNKIVLMHAEYADKVYPRLSRMYYFLNREDAATSQIYRLRTLYRDDLADQLEQSFKAVQASEALTAR